jgi:hypothetical protein
MFTSALQTSTRRVLLQQQRLYVSRAHPKPKPIFPITDALNTILEGIEERKIKRVEKWERNTEQRARQGKIKVLGIVRYLMCLMI